jgi:hypothetical protein
MPPSGTRAFRPEHVDGRTERARHRHPRRNFASGLRARFPEPVVEHAREQAADERAAIVADEASLSAGRLCMICTDDDVSSGSETMLMRSSLCSGIVPSGAGAAAARAFSPPNASRMDASIAAGSTSPTTTMAIRSGRYHVS